jgi:hypothetical protein
MLSHSLVGWVDGNDGFYIPLVAGEEYFSGREPGGGCRFRAGRGRPVDIAGSTATASPILPRPRHVCVKTAHNGAFQKHKLTEFLPEALWAEVIESVVSGLSGRHRRVWPN